MDEPARKGPLASPGFHLWTASLRWAAAVAAALTPIELTHVQRFVLGAVSWLGKTRPTAPTQREVCRWNGVDPMMSLKVVRSLEARGLVRRDDDPRDVRAWRLHLTARGEALLPRAVALVRALDAEFSGPRVATLARDLAALPARARPG